MNGLTAVSWGEGRIDLFWIGADGALWHRWWGATGWSDDERLGGEPASAPAVVSWAANEQQVFIVGRDGQLWNIYWDSRAWHHWVAMGGAFGADAQVAAATWGANRIDIFVSDADALWHRFWNGVEWVEWQREGADRPAQA
jgi:hypothetical protein